MSASPRRSRTLPAIVAALAILIVTLTSAPSQAKRPVPDGPVPVSHAPWDGEQNMAVRHKQMTVAWRLGLGG